jgi:hypothetical protein
MISGSHSNDYEAGCLSALTMEAVSSYKLINIYHTTWLNILEDRHLHNILDTNHCILIIRVLKMNMENK